LIAIDLICFDAFNCHSVLLDFDIDFFFFFFFSANVGAPLLGLVDIVDSRDVGDVVNICVILVLVGDDDEGTFVRLDIGRDVGDVVAMIVGDVVVVVGAFVKVVGNDDGTAVTLATHISLLYLAWTRDKHSVSLLLKNPISFQSGRTDMSILSQTYDRTMLLMLP
jgi:hypothetical protein